MTPALTMTLTDAGMQRFTAAQLGDAIDLAQANVAVTDADFVVSPTLTALPGAFRSIATLSGLDVGDNIVHLIVRDDDTVGYGMRGIGIVLADGTLFAVYGQADRIVEKSPASSLLLALDIAFPPGPMPALTFGDMQFVDPPATTERKGVVELATLEEAQAGDPLRVATGAVIKAMLDALAARFDGNIADLSASVDADITALANGFQAMIDAILSRRITGGGLVTGGGTLVADRQLSVGAATTAQIRAGNANDVAMTPAAIAALCSNFGDKGEFELPGGIAIKMGVYNGLIASGSVQIGFQTAFATECRAVFMTPINSTADDRRDPYLQIQSQNTGGFTGYVQKSGSDGTNIDGFQWLAIGR